MTLASLNRFLPDRFTFALILTVVFATLLPPTGIAAPIVNDATNVAIAAMFFLYGGRLSTASVLGGLAHWRFHAMVFAATFVMFPIIGVLLQGLPSWVMPQPLALGMLFLCVLPSTIQSSLAFTSIAGGNVPAAMCSATVSSLLGTIVTPLLVGLLASTHGETRSFDAIREIVVLLLLPFVAGQIMRPWINSFLQRFKSVLAITDRGSILLVVYGAFGHAVREGLWHVLPVSGLIWMVVIEAIVLAFALFVTNVAARLCGFSREDRIAIIFCGSKKSLAAGVPMAGVLFPGPNLGMILLPIMLFHQMQLMVCAALARRWSAPSSAPGRS